MKLTDKALSKNEKDLLRRDLTLLAEQIMLREEAAFRSVIHNLLLTATPEQLPRYLKRKFIRKGALVGLRLARPLLLKLVFAGLVKEVPGQLADYLIGLATQDHRPVKQPEKEKLKDSITFEFDPSALTEDEALSQDFLGTEEAARLKRQYEDMLVTTTQEVRKQRRATNRYKLSTVALSILVLGMSGVIFVMSNGEPAVEQRSSIAVDAYQVTD